MDTENAEGTVASLAKVKMICRTLNIAIWIVFIVLCVCWVISLSTIVASMMNPNTSKAGIIEFALCFAFGSVVAVIFINFSRMFADVSRDDTPFAIRQVKRLRIISAALLGYALLDNVIANSSILFQLDHVNLGYISTNESTILTVYFAPLVISAVVFAFSFVFKYGVLLQEFSDETL